MGQVPGREQKNEVHDARCIRVEKYRPREVTEEGWEEKYCDFFQRTLSAAVV